jgi:hypothetical protein
MILQRFTVDEIERLGLRVGTIHRFQGGERDLMVVVLGLSDGDPAGRWRFVEDPNLFNVMVTRARQRLIVITSVGQPPAGLVRDYLAYAEGPLGPPVPAPVGEWTTQVAAALAAAGVDVRTGYPVGRGVVDLVVGSGDTAIGVHCSVHPNGPDAHLAFHSSLQRTGWSLTDAFPTRFDGDPQHAAEELRAHLETWASRDEDAQRRFGSTAEP